MNGRLIVRLFVSGRLKTVLESRLIVRSECVCVQERKKISRTFKLNETIFFGSR